MFIHNIGKLIRVFSLSRKEPDKNVGWFKPTGTGLNKGYGLYVWDGKWIQVGGDSSSSRTYFQTDSNDILLDSSLYINTTTSSQDINLSLPDEGIFRGEFLLQFSTDSSIKTLHLPEDIIITGDKITPYGIYQLSIINNLAKITRWGTNTRVRSFSPSFSFSFR